MAERYPMKLIPAVFSKIWGGHRLGNEYSIPETGENIGEAWVLSCRPDGASVVENGAFEGKTLLWVYENEPELFGGNCRGFSEFPVLIKFIDAMDDLSVQVHPDDDYAHLHGGEGKTECWYILDCDEGARLLLGFEKEISEELFRSSAADGTLTDFVGKYEVKKGDFFFVPSGTLHAICKGVLLAEVQQNSDTTYRIFDYNRLENGKPRELKTDDAVRVTKRVPYDMGGIEKGEANGNPDIEPLISCPLFSVRRVTVDGETEACAGEESFVSLLALEGEGSLSCGSGCLEWKKGDSLLIPAGTGSFNVRGCGVLLETKI